jgi:methylmalonyl-CoA mutase N-terminal domain/subunit
VRHDQPVERGVWRYLDEIDRRGGMVTAIAEGARSARSRTPPTDSSEFDEERVIVGVSRFATTSP